LVDKKVFFLKGKKGNKQWGGKSHSVERLMLFGGTLTMRTVLYFVERHISNHELSCRNTTPCFEIRNDIL